MSVKSLLRDFIATVPSLNRGLIVKIEAGKSYVIKVVDKQTCEVSHEYTKSEKAAKNILPILFNTGKALLFMVSIFIPFLLPFTMRYLKKHRIAEEPKPMRIKA